MAKQQPDNNRVPDPATSYERAKPEKESPSGELDQEELTPEKSPDREQQAVHNKSRPEEDRHDA